MITAYSSEQAKTEAYIAGCNEYVLKPIYPEKVFFLLEKYLKSDVSVHFSDFKIRTRLQDFISRSKYGNIRASPKYGIISFKYSAFYLDRSRNL